MNKIAFIGEGIMGKSMVCNLMKAGIELHIYARTRFKVKDVIGEGAIFHNTIAEEGTKRGFHVLDAPVTGGDTGAKAGTLSGVCEALTEANMSNLNMDVLSQVLANCEFLQAEGYGDLGTQALIKYYEEELG